MNVLYLLAGISRQGHYQALQYQRNQQSKEASYVGLIEEVREMHPGMGLRTMYEQFCPEGIGRDAFIALGIQEGYRLKAIQTPHITTRIIKNRRYPNLLVNKRLTDVNQLWTSDIFYFSLFNRHYYGVLIMDVYSRRIVGWSMADNMRAENNIQALNRAFTLRGIQEYEEKLIHHSDRGAQYVSDDYTNLLGEYGVLISMCSEVLENAHIERVNGTIKNDYLKRWTIRTEAELYKKMKMAVDNYNNRQHYSLKTTPIKFETSIKDIPMSERPIMDIFTYKQNVENANQLQINFSS